jgi:hypothetical protein
MKQDTATICDLCIMNDMYLRIRGRSDTDERRGRVYYCGLDQGLGPLEGAYRLVNNDDCYNPNFICTKEEECKCTDG